MCHKCAMHVKRQLACSNLWLGVSESPFYLMECSRLVSRNPGLQLGVPCTFRSKLGEMGKMFRRGPLAPQKADSGTDKNLVGSAALKQEHMP